MSKGPSSRERPDSLHHSSQKYTRRSSSMKSHRTNRNRTSFRPRVAILEARSLLSGISPTQVIGPQAVGGTDVLTSRYNDCNRSVPVLPSFPFFDRLS